MVIKPAAQKQRQVNVVLAGNPRQLVANILLAESFGQIEVFAEKLFWNFAE
jgi:hypothetical protein